MVQAATPSRTQSTPAVRAFGRALSIGGCTAILVLASCASSTAASGPTQSAGHSSGDAESVRYRLPLRNNPIDVGRAYHCYTDCQPQPTPEGYLACLGACPGFETTEGAACLPEEVPPLAACFTARRVGSGSEPEPGSVVIGRVDGFAVVVGLASVCASSHAQCYAGTPEAR